MRILWTAVAMSAALLQGNAIKPVIAAIEVGSDRIDKVTSLYGPGAASSGGGVQAVCYFVEQDGTYLSVSTFEGNGLIQSVVLTRFAAVPPGCRNARIAGRHLTAFRGIAIGDPESSVRRVLGVPSKSGTVRLGDHDVKYLDFEIPHGRATCQFDAGKLMLVGIEAQD